MTKRKNPLKLILWVGMYILMLALNYLTPMVADDFTYAHSFADGNRITSIFQIFPSMIGHAKGLNGRIFAHFFVQLFDYLPSICFDLINAAVFVGLIFVIYHIILLHCNNLNCWQEILLIVAVFSSVWVFPLAFGEVFFWMAGSCNYLWGIFTGLLFLLPYLNSFTKEKQIPFAAKVFFIFFSIFAGGWSENISSSVIFTAVLLLLLNKFLNKKKNEKFLYFALLAAFIGFAIMAFAPAELKGKIGEFSLELIFRHFRECLNMYKEYTVLLFLYLVLFICSLVDKTELKTILLSAVFFLCSLVSNFILIFASYYSGRSSACVAIFLIIADGILLISLLQSRKALTYSCLAIVSVSALYWGIIGSIDILNVHSQIKANENIILDSKEQGNRDIQIPLVRVHTKYSPGFHISTEDKTTWPNNVIAEYYGIDSILGYETEHPEEEE